ncbi:MAG TPA: beta-ketoacyl-[acyl-carrier-protein] synthase family protein [Chthoniobacteraceae bacterium]|nr:beta-ketoacyl-[acyl-carrier-protein] synthase family protein [Chthoniobacteraceae bacterium]
MPDSQKRSSRRVAVTGIGVVSPLGINVRENLTGLQEARDAVSDVAMFDVSKCRSKTAGQVLADWQFPGARKEWHRASHFMAAAMTEAQSADPGFAPELAVIGTTSGGMSFGEAFYRMQASKSKDLKRASWLANYMPQKAVLDALGSSGWSTPTQIIANACASGTNALGHAFQLIRAGLHERVVAGGYDAISELVFVGFDSLQASTSERVRPFDAHRTGLVLGEGAAALLLEDWESAIRRGAPIVAEITGYGVATDNFHLTQPNPSGIGPRLAMQRAIQDAGCAVESIDYINAHGTATAFNDATEGMAISQLFGDRVPVSSTKSMMGHSLGAAGAIEAVFSILALRHQFLPPNINYATPDLSWKLDVVSNEARKAELRTAISNSFGFGGTNASLILQAAA